MDTSSARRTARPSGALPIGARAPALKSAVSTMAGPVAGLLLGAFDRVRRVVVSRQQLLGRVVVHVERGPFDLIRQRVELRAAPGGLALRALEPSHLLDVGEDVARDGIEARVVRHGGGASAARVARSGRASTTAAFARTTHPR